MTDTPIQESAEDLTPEQEESARIDKILSGDDPAEDSVLGSPPAPTSESESESADPPKEDEASAEVAEPEAPAPVEVGANAEPKPATPEAEPAAPSRPVEYAPLTEAVAALDRIDAIDEKVKAMDAKLEDAELDPDEHAAQLRLLERERGQLDTRVEIIKGRMDDERASAESAFWADESNNVFRDNPVLLDSLNAQIIAMRNDSAALAHGQEWILSEAKRLLKESYDQAFAPPADDTPAPAEPAIPPPADAAQVAKDKVAAARAKPPMSLSDVPGGTAAPVDEFAKLDGQSVVSRLDSLLSMPADKVSQWLDRRV